MRAQRSLKPEETPVVDERPRLPASEIEKLLLDALRRPPTLRNTQSVMIRPFSGPKGWSWELDRIEPNVGLSSSRLLK
jgi:hypothetical protein